jgi:dethiobiotin synthetase
VARACFVTATGTGVGKTIVSAAIAAGLAGDGVGVSARKPIATGVGGGVGAGPDLAGLDDHELLAALTGERPEEVAPLRFEPAVSPHLAAAQAGVTIDVAGIVAGLRERAGDVEALIVEGIGGLLVPIAPGWDVRRLAGELGWPVVVVASPALGTINHTLLTLEAARAAGLDVRAVVMTPWPAEPEAIERSNRETVASLGGVAVETLPVLASITRETLAAAAGSLPYELWLDG